MTANLLAVLRFLRACCVRASHSRRLLDERLPKRWKRNQACPAIAELVIEIISPEQAMKEIEEAE